MFRRPAARGESTVTEAEPERIPEPAGAGPLSRAPPGGGGPTVPEAEPERIPEPAVSVVIEDPAIESKNLSVWYRRKQAIKDVSLRIPRRKTTAIIGPSGCGKSTYLRAINRMNDTILGCRTTGEMLVEKEDAYAPNAAPAPTRAASPRLGCGACPQVDSIPAEQNRKAGTDLRHVTEKLSARRSSPG